MDKDQSYVTVSDGVLNVVRAENVFQHSQDCISVDKDITEADSSENKPPAENTKTMTELRTFANFFSNKFEDRKQVSRQ